MTCCLIIKADDKVNTVFVLFNAQVLLNAHPLITKMSADIFFPGKLTNSICHSDRRKGVQKIYHTYVEKHMGKLAGSNGDPCLNPLWRVNGT